MTKYQATAIRQRWAQRAYAVPCAHLTLELERSDRGHATGKYVCTLCGKFVAQQRRRAA